MSAIVRRGVPAIWLLLGALALGLGVTSCLREAPATPDELNLGKYRYAVSVFNNHGGYNDRAEADLALQGLIIIEPDDARLTHPEITKLTLYCTFDMVVEGLGLAARMTIRDDQGRELLQAHARRIVDLVSIDAVISSLAPYRAVGAPPPPKPGTIIEM